MVILKKLKGSTLVETLVATVLIMVIFIISSMILNNLFVNSIKQNRRAITAKMNEVEYLFINEKINESFRDDYKDWTIIIVKDKQRRNFTIKAENIPQNLTIERLIIK